MKSILTRVALSFFLFVFLIPNFAFSETKTYIKEYTYRASEADSKLSSRTTAMAEVKRLLLEELGTYLESITEVKNFQLTKDQITALTAGIVKVEVIDERWNGETYWIKTKIVADANDVIRSIDRLSKDRQKSQELENTKKKVDIILRENKILREELALANENAKQEVQQRYNNSIKELSAIEWFEEGFKYFQKANYEKAIPCYDKAIELNPNYALVYGSRGSIYAHYKKYNKAIIDLNKAIELNPNETLAYMVRGYVYNMLKKYNEAIIDLNKAIELNPNIDAVYNNRGFAHRSVKKYNEAIIDLNKAIELNPKYDSAYNGRAQALIFLGKINEAFVDFNKAIELNPKNQEARYFRGLINHAFGKYNEAIIDFNKTIELNPKDWNAYYSRAVSYSITGHPKESIQDLKKAIQLNPTCRNDAKTDEKFDNIRNTNEFKKLIGQ